MTTRPRVSLVAAVAENGVIGADGDLPWRLPDDMKRFRTLTTGHCVIMGRKTFDSMQGRALPKRTNVVLSRKGRDGAPAGVDPAVHWVADLAAALAIAEEAGDDEAFVIGGEAIYALALPDADRLYLTRVHAEVEGQVRFPDYDPDGFRLTYSERHEADDRHAHAFTFEDWERV